MHGPKLTLEGLEARALLSASMVQEIVPPGGFGGTSANLTDVNGSLYFTITDRTWGAGAGTTELWRSDGTPAGTLHLKDFPGADTGTAWQLSNLTAVNSTLFFQVRTASDVQLWRSDGTSAGTVEVEAFKNITQIAAFEGEAYFVVNNSYLDTTWVLWKSGRTAATTMAVQDTGVIYSPLVAVNDKLYFAARDAQAIDASQLWVSDGTSAGTGILKDINPGQQGSGLYTLTAANNKLFFLSGAPSGQVGLWVSDGTAGGTNFLQAAPHDGGYELHGEDGGNLSFLDYRPNSLDWWTTDGTPAGTVLKASGPPLPLSSLVSYIGPTIVNNTMYFLLEKPDTFELWKSNGTAAGATPVYVGTTTNHVITQLVNVNGTLFFDTYDPDTDDTQLWQSDGTATGTFVVEHALHSGSTELFTAVNGLVYFTVDDGRGVQIWRDNPTAGPTAMAGGPYTTYFGESIALNGRASTGTGPLSYSWTVNGHSAQGGAGEVVLSPSALASYGITSPGTYPLFLTVKDVNGTSTSPAELNLLNPFLDVGGVAGTATEEDAFQCTVARFSDLDAPLPPDAYSAQIDWGDGSAPSAGAVLVNVDRVDFSVFAGHTYTEEGTYSVTVSVAKAGAPPNTATTTMTVADAPFWTGRQFLRATEGHLLTGTVATIIDGNSFSKVGDFTATIRWGDGSTTKGTLTQTGPGQFAVQGGHAYAAAGRYAVTVTVADKGGSTSTANSIFQVDDIPLRSVPQIMLGGTISAGGIPSILAGFTDANPLATAGQFTATIDWGDGTTSSGTVARAKNQPYFVVSSGNHKYAKSGRYKVTTTVRDAGGSSLSTLQILQVFVSITPKVAGGNLNG
jgi:ELWxxDGT repeat protein